MTYKDKASYGSSPPSTLIDSINAEGGEDPIPIESIGLRRQCTSIKFIHSWGSVSWNYHILSLYQIHRCRPQMQEIGLTIVSTAKLSFSFHFCISAEFVMRWVLYPLSFLTPLYPLSFCVSAPHIYIYINTVTYGRIKKTQTQRIYGGVTNCTYTYIYIHIHIYIHVCVYIYKECLTYKGVKSCTHGVGCTASWESTSVCVCIYTVWHVKESRTANRAEATLCHESTSISTR